MTIYDILEYSNNIKKYGNCLLTVENKCASMKDALLWCYMPNYLYYSIYA